MATNQKLASIFTRLQGAINAELQIELIASLNHKYPDTHQDWISFVGIERILHEIGDVLNLKQASEELIDSIQERRDILIHKMKFISHEHRKKVLYLQDINPPNQILDPYLEELIITAGGLIYKIDSEKPFNPDIIIIVSKKDSNQLLSEIPEVFSSETWKNTNAIKNNNLYIINNPLYLRNGGLLISEDAEILAEIINPGYFIFGRDEDVWMNYSM